MKASWARIPFPIVRVVKLCIEWCRGKMYKCLLFRRKGFLLHVVEQVVCTKKLTFFKGQFGSFSMLS
jgi:hypothetical protein